MAYDAAYEKYTATQKRKAKQAALSYYKEMKGEVSVKVLSRKAKAPQGIIRKWMKDGDWENLFEKNPISEETMKTIQSAAEQFNLTEQEETFCYHYIKTRNATTSAIRAGYSSSYAHNKAHRLLQDQRILSFIKHIRDQMNQELFVDALDVARFYVKAGFADITDFVTFGSGGVVPKNSNNVDGQLIAKIKEGRDGISIELVDRYTALSKLEDYLQFIPNWKQKVEEEKVKLMREKLDFEKSRASGDYDETEDDGFIEALRGSVKEVWADYEEEEA